MELRLVLGGPQGAGLETSMTVLARALARLGYGVLADREYFSNIKGRHSYVHMTVSWERIPRSLDYPVHALLAMDAETVLTHFEDIADDAVLLYDTGSEGVTLTQIPSMEDCLKQRLRERLRELGVGEAVGDVVRYLRGRGVRAAGIDYREVLAGVAKEHGLLPSQASRYLSAILVAGFVAAYGISEEAVEEAFRERFRGREELVKHNMAVVRAAAPKIREAVGVRELPEPRLGLEEVVVASGNDAVAMGKLVAGLSYQAYYPITPAADESLLLERYEDSAIDGEWVGAVVLQTEDEISAISSVIGAALTGARAATATSGPGFSLMVEALSWAGHNEVPIVITYYQRGGPSTGLPTRGSQSDLMFAVHAGHGEFPRIVISSGDHEEALEDAVWAFNLAERYQLPVIHLLDKFLANSLKTFPIPDTGALSIDRGEVVEGGEGYRRFDLSHTISPRAFIGGGAVMWYTGDEHDEAGHICEDPVNRVRMYDKRMAKLRLIEEGVPTNRKLAYYGDPSPDVLLVGWGSVKGPALDVVEELMAGGFSAAYLHLRMLHPLPAEAVRQYVSEAGVVVAVEHSYEVQVADLIALRAGVRIVNRVAKYTGRPIYRGELLRAVLRFVKGYTGKEVLTYGA